MDPGQTAPHGSILIRIHSVFVRDKISLGTIGYVQQTL